MQYFFETFLIDACVRGAMQSMHLFLAERKLQRGVRLSHENYSRYGVIETAPLYTAENLVKHTYLLISA
jgi:hypothetical protein